MTMNLKVVWLTLILAGVDSDKTGYKSFYWSEWKPGDKPVGSVVGTKNRYIGRVYTKQGLLVASINFDKQLAVPVKIRQDIHRNGIEILRTYAKDQLYWEGVVVSNTTSTKVFRNAIRGGFYQNSSSTLYIGRIKLKTGTKLGMAISPKTKQAGLWIHVKRNGLKQVNKFQLLKYKMPTSELCEF